MTRLAEQRRALPPGPIITNHYRFKDANGSELRLIDLFSDHDALVTYCCMFGPQRERPCPMCTNWLGAVNGNAADIKQRVALKVIGRSPVARQLAFAVERGWRHLDFVQTVGDDYADDLGLLSPLRAPSAPGSRRLCARRRHGAPVLGERDDDGHGRSGPGPARRARHCPARWLILDLTPEAAAARIGIRSWHIETGINRGQQLMTGRLQRPTTSADPRIARRRAR